MNKYLYLGVLFATVALIFYSLSFWINRKKIKVNKVNCILQTTGLEFDIVGTVLMIIGSKNIPITVHGFIGYSALLAMIIETILIVKTMIKDYEKQKSIRIYSWVSYIWWITAYIAGGIIAMVEIKR